MKTDITIENCTTANVFYHKTIVNKSNKLPAQLRRNGKTKTWKSRPGLFKIPVKYGLYDYGYITNFEDWKIKRYDSKDFYIEL